MTFKGPCDHRVIDVGSFPLPVAVLKGALLRGFLYLLQPIVVTVTVRGNDLT